jgi:TRAP-type C4-dicarboxylate transport system permease small subunit
VAAGEVALSPIVGRAAERVRRGAEVVVSALLGIMFVAFILQIVFRYVLNFPIGWSSELSVVAWLYMVLLGSAFWLKEREEIRFDLISGRLRPLPRRVVAVAVSLAMAALFAMALPATIRYVAFMKVESSSYLKIRLDVLYSVYVLFAVAVVARYLGSAWTGLRGDVPVDEDVAQSGSGL